MELDYTKLALMALAGLVVFGVTLKWPILGLWVYAGSIGIDYMMGVVGLRIPGSSVGQVMLVLLLVTSVIQRLRDPSPVLPLCRSLYAFTALFLIGLWASVLFSEVPEVGVYAAAVTTFTATLPFLVETLVRTQRQLRTLLWALGLGVALSGAIGIAQFAGVLSTVTAADAVDDDGRGRVDEVRTADRNAEARRFSGTTRNPNAFASVLLGGIPALYYLSLGARGKYLRFVAMGALAVCAFALLITLARTYLLAFFLFVLIFTGPLLITGRIPRWLILVGCVVALGGFIYGLQHVAGVLDRLQGISSDASAYTRREVMFGGVKAFLHNPLVGIGVNNTALAGYGPLGVPSHDSLSGILGELGLLGAGTLALICIQGFSMARTASRHCRLVRAPELGTIAYFCLVSLVTVLVTGVGNAFYGDRAFWMNLGLCAATYRVSLAIKPKFRPRPPHKPVANEESVGAPEAEQAGSVWPATGAARPAAG